MKSRLELLREVARKILFTRRGIQEEKFIQHVTRHNDFMTTILGGKTEEGKRGRHSNAYLEDVNLELDMRI